MIYNVNSCKEVESEYYKNPTDTEVVSNFRSCAPIKHMKYILEDTDQLIFRSTSTWQFFLTKLWMTLSAFRPLVLYSVFEYK